MISNTDNKIKCSCNLKNEDLFDINFIQVLGLDDVMFKSFGLEHLTHHPNILEI